MFPMMPMMPMMSMPFSGMVSQQPNAEQTAQMQRLALQNQQLQLKQMRQMVEQYARSIDAALEQIDEQIAKVEKGEITTVQAQVQMQAQSLGQIQQFQSQALAQRARLCDPFCLNQRLSDLLADPRRMDQQLWVAAGLGDFGRPVI